SAHVVRLNSGYDMPIFGLGTCQSLPGEVTKAVENAIAIGYRHFDCALIYRNEAEIGNTLKEQFEAGTIKREELFITSKLCLQIERVLEAAAIPPAVNQFEVSPYLVFLKEREPAALKGLSDWDEIKYLPLII
ncbi:unnamed protein product, partial [Allacma fusca]